MRRRGGGGGGDGGGGGGEGVGGGRGGGGDGSHSPPTHLGHGFSQPAWKVGNGDLSQPGNDGQTQVPAGGLPLSHCTGRRSGWGRAPDN